jgi:hypothetical protein
MEETRPCKVELVTDEAGEKDLAESREAQTEEESSY